MRLRTPRGAWLRDLLEYLNGHEFLAAIRTRFDLAQDQRVETVIQKYLSGYEISPHPDIRRKSATYMININDPAVDYGDDLHTHLLRFNPEYEWIYEQWAAD